MKTIAKQILCLKCNQSLTINITKEQICPYCAGRGCRELSDKNCSYCKGYGFIISKKEKYHEKCRLEKIKELKKEIEELESIEEKLNSLLPYMPTGCNLCPY